MNKDETKEEIDEQIDVNENGFVLSKKVKYVLIILVVIIFISTLIIAFSYTNKLKDSSIAQTNADLEKTLNLSISIDEKFIDVGQELKIEILSKLDNAQEIKWESSAPEIISVIDGKITGLTIGKCKIYAYIGENKSNELELECLNKIDSVVINKTETKIEVGKTDKIDIKITPEDATYKEFTWTSSDNNIAKVENGLITGMNIGECEIKAIDYTKAISITCKVEVIPVEIESLLLDETSVTLGKGQKYILLSSYTPNNATNTDIVWSSSDSNIIKVDKGKITAVNTGTATVTITSTNGVKATCNFSVTQNAQSGEIKYAVNQYNIRSGPGTDYEKIISINKNDEIQILKTANGWSKIRTEDGTVGFIISNAYSSSKSYEISGVPYINQFNLGYPTGCEAVSAAMAAQYSGYNISPATIIENTPTDERGIWTEIVTVQISQAKYIAYALGEINNELDLTSPTDNEVDNAINNTINNNVIDNTISNDTTNTTPIPDSNQTPEVTPPKTETKEVTYGGNPFEVFVGHPTKKLGEGSYGCFAAPIVTALNKSGVPCTNISNCSQDTLLNYIRQGKPVIVWCVKNAGDLIIQETWQYPDGSGSFTKLKGEHCAVLIGYDDEYVYLNDPSAGKNVKQPKSKFFSNWNQLYCQAIIIN